MFVFVWIFYVTKRQLTVDCDRSFRLLQYEAKPFLFLCQVLTVYNLSSIYRVSISRCHLAGQSRDDFLVLNVHQSTLARHNYSKQTPKKTNDRIFLTNIRILIYMSILNNI